MAFVFHKAHLFLALLVCGGIFVVLTSLPDSHVFGVALFFLYLGLVSASMRDVLAVHFHFPMTALTRWLAVFWTLFVVSALAGVALLLTALTPLVIMLVLSLAALLIIILAGWAVPPVVLELPVGGITFGVPVGLGSTFGVVAYFVLVLQSFLMLHLGRPGALSTPWQIIPANYIYLFAVTTALLGMLMFSRLRAGTLLVLLVIHSFLLTAYLPLTHDSFYGADGWRHMGYVDSVRYEEPLIQATLTSAPSIGAHLGTLAYGQFWGLLALVGRLAGISTITLIAWFMPLFWSLLFPFLLYKFGELFGFGEKGRLTLVWLAFVPFALQVAGAFTLPVNLGLLFWLLNMLLVLSRARQPKSGQVGILLLVGVLSIFSYSLFCILYWFSWAVVEALIMARSAKALVRHTVLWGGAVLGALLIPAIELVTRYSAFDSSVHWFAQLRQLIGNFTGFYLASGPRPHDILTGNILFNQIPAASFVVNAFTTSRWWLVIVAVTFWLLAAFGWWQATKMRSVVHEWLAIFAVTVFGGYAISRYFLVGEQLFARRLDGVLAITALCLAFIGGLTVIAVLKTKKIPLQRFAVLFILLASAATAASYSLGPDTTVVTTDTFQAMYYVALNTPFNGSHCVLADATTLLPLEALTRRHIIGGGFPIDQYYGQSERESLWRAFQTNPGMSLWDQALQATHASDCWLIINNVRAIPGAVVTKTFGTAAVYHYSR